jgi:hypothetical protein
VSKRHYHFCSKDRLFFECTDPDPEMKRAKCPACGGNLILGHGDSLESAKVSLGLSPREIGTGVVTYTLIKKE